MDTAQDFRAQPGHYDDAKAILADGALTKTQKIAALKVFIDDQNALIRAAGEGMAGGEDQKLRDAEKALAQLEGTEPIKD